MHGRRRVGSAVLSASNSRPCVTDPEWWVDVEVIFGNLGRAAWQNWPKAQRISILDLFHAVLDELVEQGDERADEFDSWVCAMARAGISPLPYLINKMENDQLNPVLQFHLANANSLMKGKLSNPFWEGELADSIVKWLETPVVKAALDKAYEEKYGNGA